MDALRVAKSIHVSKSSGIENFSSYVLKEAFLILITQITFLCNLSVKVSIFPKAWKQALVIPIPKSGNLTYVGTNRPISLLTLMSKLLKKL